MIKIVKKKKIKKKNQIKCLWLERFWWGLQGSSRSLFFFMCGLTTDYNCPLADCMYPRFDKNLNTFNKWSINCLVFVHVEIRRLDILKQNDY